MAHITLSESAFFHNLALLSKRLGGIEKLAVVLKDNAYGHGLAQMSALCARYGIQKAVVRTCKEAHTLKGLFRKIIVLAPEQTENLNPSFSLTINTLSQIATLPPNTDVELKVDTGMHRNGIKPEELHEAFRLLRAHKLKLHGVMTHFRSADELSSDLFWQLQIWKEVKQTVYRLCKQYEYPLPLFHSANSAATLRLQTYEDDFARCGLATYGYHEMDPVFGKFDLKPVLKLYADRIATTTLEKGARIGYGGTFTVSRPMQVSTYDIGYGDGFFRYDGKGHFKVDGKQVLGRISMDSLSLEGNAKRVCILENAKETARFFGTISYDVLVKLNPDIERVVTP